LTTVGLPAGDTEPVVAGAADGALGGLALGLVEGVWAMAAVANMVPAARMAMYVLVMESS
jgi:hypothetical protein